MICIYKLVFPNNEFYIGQTQNYSRRMSLHKCTEGAGSPKLERAYANQAPPTYEVLEECTLNDLNIREVYWIKELKPTLNTLPGGDGMRGLNHPRSKYTEKQLNDIKYLFLNTDSTWCEIINLTGVSRSTVSDVCNRKTHIWLFENTSDEEMELNLNKRKSILNLVIYSPEGVKFTVNNLSEFELQHNIRVGGLSSLNTGKVSSASGWTLEPTIMLTISTPDNEQIHCSKYHANKFFISLGFTKYNVSQLMSNCLIEGYSIVYVDEKLNTYPPKYTSKQINEVKDLFLNTDVSFEGISRQLNISTNSVLEICSRKDLFYDRELLSNAHKLRVTPTIVYSPEGVPFKVSSASEFEKEHLLNKGSINRLKTRGLTKFSAQGWTLEPPVMLNLKTPTGTFNLSEYYVHKLLKENLSDYSITQIIKKNKESKGYLIIK